MVMKMLTFMVVDHARLPEKNFRFLIMLRNSPRKKSMFTFLFRFFVFFHYDALGFLIIRKVAA